MPKDYSLEDYSTPGALAKYSEGIRDKVRRFIHHGTEFPELDSLIQKDPALAAYIDQETEKKL